MDIKNVEVYYQKMSDDKLIRIATMNAHGLRPEVWGILKNEIKKRNLNPDLLKGAVAQNKEYTSAELEFYAARLRDLPCPICGNTKNRLNGTTLYTVKSAIMFTVAETELIIACPDCLDKKNDDAILSTACLGWWEIPEGLFKSPVYIYRNFKAKKENRLKKANAAILSFTLKNIGKIEAYKDDKEQLGTIIKPKKY